MLRSIYPFTFSFFFRGHYFYFAVCCFIPFRFFSHFSHRVLVDISAVSQEVVSITELDWQFSPPVNPEHLCIILGFWMDGSHSPWKPSLTPFLFHSVFVGFMIQIGFNHPWCLLYFHKWFHDLAGVFSAINKSSRFSVASPIMKPSKGVAQRRSSEEVIVKSSYERSTSIASLS